MSELLGWYGYEKVDSGCTRSLNLDHFTSLPHARNSQILQVDPSFISNKMKPKSSASLAAINSPFDVSSLSLPYSVNSLAAVGGEMLSSPLSLKMGALDFTANHPYKNFLSSTCSDNTSCSWCGRITQTCNSGRIDSLSCNMINTAGHFCSEACFAAGRRAVFKRAKTCDWCRHIRNPISHVDFQDGESQLQFCSDKCLNQYKMNIFCHETRTHLMLHGLNNVSCHDTEKSNLITPELWFRNCQSPAGSPTEDTRATDEHVRTDETSCRDNKSKETEQNEIQNRAKYEKSTNVSSKTEASVQSNEADASIHALPTSLLPPVTVLVPYPIPVPIPIPIPVPIPAPILNKFMDNEQKLSANTKDEKYNNFKCNESLKNKCSVPHDSQICTNTNISVPEDQQHIASTKLCVSLSSSTGNNESNANTHSSKHNAKPPRKRKHLNENVNYEHKEQKLKKRNKFIAT
ncbi:Sine oculis-binding protein like protein [Dufourea novaeangliae]|uniref:Sine oculis-binding protein like protein n=1 Tax=Dufourea novaeangliae TaxID=178035 RepID=A0A154PLY8_DUFNO|nr:Sine oculis-binding protein like protein [Dufourea novaeangliae]